MRDRPQAKQDDEATLRSWIILGEPKLMNFENAEGIDFDISEEEIMRGVSIHKYPISNELFASFNAI